MLADMADSLSGLRESVVEQLPDEDPERLRGWIRPPGALPEDQFRETCTQCSDCREACPYDSIRRIGPEFGQDAGFPAIIPHQSPCHLCEDMPCIAACEPHALLPVTPNTASMGTAVIHAAACYVTQGQPCDYCVVRCPLKADAIAFGESGMPIVNTSGCVGCGVCAHICPADAITIEPRLS